MDLFKNISLKNILLIGVKAVILALFNSDSVETL